MFVEMMNLNISRVMPDLKTNRKESGDIFPQFGNNKLLLTWYFSGETRQRRV